MNITNIKEPVYRSKTYGEVYENDTSKFAHIRDMILNDFKSPQATGSLLNGITLINKYKFVEIMGDMLNISQERCHYNRELSWNNPRNKNEEDEIGLMFEPVLKDCIEYGDEAPLHLLVIDKIRSLIQNYRAETYFLCALEEHLNKRIEYMNKVIIIGLTDSISAGSVSTVNGNYVRCLIEAGAECQDQIDLREALIKAGFQTDKDMNVMHRYKRSGRLELHEDI